MQVKFWGARGSVPVPGRDTIKYGGNTPCIQIDVPNNDIIILDAGTGIRELGNCLPKDSGGRTIHLFISHTHFDHIQGLPFFAPFYSGNYKVRIYTSAENEFDPSNVIDSQMQPYFFPVTKNVFNAELDFIRLKPDGILRFGDITLESKRVHHSAGTLSYKLTEKDKSVVYMTDNELYFENLDDEPKETKIWELNRDLIDYVSGVDYLIHDCMYNLENFPDKLGWGHSNNKALAYFAHLAEIRNLILFHYDPDYNDEVIEKMLLDTREILKRLNSGVNCLAAKEGLEIDAQGT